MNSYKPYRNPGFMDGEPGPPAVEFKTTEELLALDDVKQTYRPDTEYALSDGYLIAVTDDGFYWWVLGKIGDPAAVNLPAWGGGKYKVKLNNGEETVLQVREVYSICGDEITLRDGSKAMRLPHKNKS